MKSRPIEVYLYKSAAQKYINERVVKVRKFLLLILLAVPLSAGAVEQPRAALAWSTDAS